MTVAPPKSGHTRRPTDDETFYPSGDGKPMAENDECRLQAIYCMDTLRIRYQQRMDVYVAGDNFVYYEEGQPKKVVSPDVYVVFGVEKRVRKSYMTWRENGVVPTVVIEITSKSTAKEDIKKRALYEKLGVFEYFQFDPNGDYLDPRLQGLRLMDGRYVSIAPETEALSAAPSGPLRAASSQSVPLRVRSQQLGLDLVVEGDYFRFYDVATGEPLLGASELAQARDAAEKRAEQAEAELVRLRAELEALRRERAE